MPDELPAFLVDIDGTLVDTNYFHVVAWWRGFQDIGEDVAMSRILPLIGMGSDQMVHRLIGRESKEASDAHSHHYESFKKEIKAFPEAAELLANLAQRGARVVLATSSDEEDLERLREAVDAEDAVHGAVSKGDVEHSKPSPDIFGAALEKFDLDPSRTLVLGDTEWDVEAAGKLGLEVVCVLTGGSTREHLEHVGAIAVYEDVAELLVHLDESTLSKLLDG
jgi:HAD superfamily hydrolase (TIGR01509 family)